MDIHIYIYIKRKSKIDIPYNTTQDLKAFAYIIGLVHFTEI